MNNLLNCFFDFIKDILCEIKQQIKKIECKLDNPLYGLKEIKKEIKDIEDKMNTAPAALTTGPVIRSAGVGNLYVKVLNNTSSTQQVRVNLYDLDQCPKVNVAHDLLTINSKCAVLKTFDIGEGRLDLEEFEVELEFLGARRGIYAFVAGAQGNSFNLEPSNTFRHEELVPQIDP